MKHYTEFDKTADCFDIQEIKRGKHKEVIKRCNNVFTFDTEASTYYLYCDEKGLRRRLTITSPLTITSVAKSMVSAIFG